MEPKYQYAAEAFRVVDGDTVYAKVSLGFGQTMGDDKMPFKIRVADCYCKELNSEDADERVEAQNAKAFTVKAVMVLSEKKLIVVTRKTRAGKEKSTFGRWVADVYYQDEGEWYNLAEELISAGLATREPE